MTNTLIIAAIGAAVVLTFAVGKSVIKKIKNKRKADKTLNFEDADKHVETLEDVSDTLIEQLLSCSGVDGRAVVTRKIYEHLHGIDLALACLAPGGLISRLDSGDADKRAQLNTQMEKMRQRLTMCREALSEALQKAVQATVTG